MDATTSTTIDALLALPGVSVAENDFEFDCEFELDICTPGVCLMLPGDKYYDFPADGLEAVHEPITYGELAKAGLLPLLDPEFGEADDDYEIETDDLHPLLIEHLWSLANHEEEAYDIAKADAYADYVMDQQYADATDWIVYSPRGFGNERSLYAVKAGEKPKALKWLRDTVLDANNSNERYRVEKPEAVRKMLAEHYWDTHHTDSAIRQRGGTLGIAGWWGQED